MRHGCQQLRMVWKHGTYHEISGIPEIQGLFTGVRNFYHVKLNYAIKILKSLVSAEISFHFRNLNLILNLILQILLRTEENARIEPQAPSG